MGAKRAAQLQVDAHRSGVVAVREARNVRFDVWLVDYQDSADLDEMLVGVGLVEAARLDEV